MRAENRTFYPWLSTGTGLFISLLTTASFSSLFLEAVENEMEKDQ